MATATAKASSEATMDQRLQQAQAFKEEGNRCYKEGRLRAAVSRYHWALLQVKGLDPSVPSPLQEFGAERPPVTPEQEKALHSTQSDCYNNLAACLLQMEPVNYDRVKEYSLKVLERRPENTKALYRAGVAFYHLRDYDRARHHLLAATSKQPKVVPWNLNGIRSRSLFDFQTFRNQSMASDWLQEALLDVWVPKNVRNTHSWICGVQEPKHPGTKAFGIQDANVKRYLQLTESQLNSYHEKEKQLYMGMFG